MGKACGIALKWMPQNIIKEDTILVQVRDSFRQGHRPLSINLSKCLRYVSLGFIIRLNHRFMQACTSYWEYEMERVVTVICRCLSQHTVRQCFVVCGCGCVWEQWLPCDYSWNDLEIRGKYWDFACGYNIADLSGLLHDSTHIAWKALHMIGKHP